MLLALVAYLSCSGYVNNFPQEDNAFGVKLPTTDVYNNSFAFLIADYGLATAAMSGECCQTDVADMMRKKRKDLEAAGKSLLFVGAGGDNFYWTGLKDAGKGADVQWQRWNTVYQGLNDVPWLATFGNHDHGDSDLYTTCPEKAPRVTVAGQPYASNQLDVDKGGYRPAIGNTHNFHLPDFSYRMGLAALNLEVFGIDQNYVDLPGIGGDATGHAKKLAACGGGESELGKRLQDIGHSGEALLAQYAAAGASNSSRTRNVLVLQHYPGVCASLEQTFRQSVPAGEQVDFRCSFGHTHNTVCENGTAAECKYSMNGGGGGCCANDVTKSQAGFGVLTFSASGGMNIELMSLGRPCVFEPAGMSAAERELAHRFDHGKEHTATFAAAKLEVNAAAGSSASGQ